MSGPAKTLEILEGDAPRVAEIVRRVEAGQLLSAEGAELIEAMFATYFQLAQLAQEEALTIERLRAWVGGTVGVSRSEARDEFQGERHARQAH